MRNFPVNQFCIKHQLLITFLLVQTSMRIILSSMTKLHPGQVLSAASVGMTYDLFLWLLLTAPLRLVGHFVPPRMKAVFNWTLIKAPLLFVFVSCLLFVAVAEWNFWAEFHSRFNFIAVDYLIYSKEVLDNILESFPMGKILAVMFLVAAALTTLLVWLEKKALPPEPLLRPVPALLLLCFLLPLGLWQFVLPTFDTIFPRFPQEQLSRNSYLEFYRAYRSNRISYRQFYKTIDQNRMRVLTSRPKLKGPVVFQNQRPNVIILIQESLGAKFIRDLGGQKDTTPFLNGFASKSMFFTKLYSTGTRTVRGLEAINLSVPPTPGYAVVKRPQQPGIASIGSVFKRQRYKMRFMYGGYGYFDNMNAFFENIGFEILDKHDFAKEEVTFSNAWGACDEDLYRKALRVADEDAATHEPFLHVMLSTSNHRPFTYPEGKIDIPSGQERKGAVKYTDYALSVFFKEAEKKPWFHNTLFVVVADHSTEGRGEFDLDMNDFHIPMWIYAPAFIKPERIEKLGSQVDVIPTVLGMLGWEFSEPFFGHDLRVAEEQRAFIGNYQQVGYYESNEITTLAPNRLSKHYSWSPEEKKQRSKKREADILHEEKAIAHFQLATDLLDNNLFRPKEDPALPQPALSQK